MHPLVLALTLLWTPAENVEGYRIYTIDSVGNPWSLHEDIGPQSPDADGYITYTTPDPAVLTLYQVRAYNDVGETPMDHSLVGFDPEVSGSPPVWPESKKLGTVR